MVVGELSAVVIESGLFSASYSVVVFSLVSELQGRYGFDTWKDRPMES
jgi:hypothetical protein